MQIAPRKSIVPKTHLVIITHQYYADCRSTGDKYNTVLLPTNLCCSITELHRHPASRAFLSLAQFWRIQKGLTMN